MPKWRLLDAGGSIIHDPTATHAATLGLTHILPGGGIQAVDGRLNIPRCGTFADLNAPVSAFPISRQRLACPQAIRTRISAIIAKIGQPEKQIKVGWHDGQLIVILSYQARPDTA